MRRRGKASVKNAVRDGVIVTLVKKLLIEIELCLVWISVCVSDAVFLEVLMVSA